MDIDAEQIRYLGDVQRLNLQQGDILIISVEQHLSVESMARIKQTVESVIPGHKCRVRGRGMKIGAVAG